MDEGFGTVNNAAIWAEDTFGEFVFFGDESETMEQDSSHIGYVPYPTEGSSAGYQNVTGYFISSKTQQRQACWEWIKFLSSQPSAAAGGIPAHIGAAESDAYAQLVGSAKAETFRSIMANSSQSSELSRFMRGSSWLSITSSWLNQAHTNIVNNGISVEEAMQQAQSKADAYRSCVIEKDAFTNSEKQSECINEVDPNLFG
jgi:ABC-type glycerol-3-phosphate transport system substrate-binding protein